MKHSHAINENLDLLYTLDRHDIDEGTNDTDRERMKKYINGVLNEFLTERQRQIVKMYYEESQTIYEIAKTLGICHQTAHKILLKSMDKIKKHIKIFK